MFFCNFTKIVYPLAVLSIALLACRLPAQEADHGAASSAAAQASPSDPHSSDTVVIQKSASSGSGESESQAEADAAPAPKLPDEPEANAPASSPGQPFLSAEGLLLPREQARLASQVEGVLDEILVKEGQPVEQGQPILRLNSREQQLRVRFAEESARKAANDLESARRLLSENLISRTEYERAVIDKAAADASLELARLQLEYHTLRSPFRGHVFRINKRLGEAVQRFEQLAEVVNFHEASALVYLEARYLPELHTGMSVTVHPQLENAVPRNGVVEYVDPVVDPGTGIFRVKITIPRSEDSPAIPTGVRARVGFFKKS